MSAGRSNPPAGFRLPRRSILRGKNSFSHVFQHGKRISGKLVDLRYAIPQPPARGIRTAFIAGRKLGNAVARNRSKRLLREAFRLQQHILDPVSSHITDGLHLALIIKSGGFSYQEIHQEIEQMLQRLSDKLVKNGDMA